MYKIAEYVGDDAKRFAANKQPLGMGLREGLTKRTYVILVYGSSFSDPGPDKTTMVAFDNDNIKLATVTVDGY